MKAFLSSIGSRGDIEPILALAVELRALGHEAVLAVMPHFVNWVQSSGIACIALQEPYGDDKRQVAQSLTRSLFQATAVHAPGCDAIIGCGPHPLAGRSIAEHLDIPYLYACLSPPLLRKEPGGDISRFLYKQNWAFVGDPINQERAAIKLPPLADPRRHAITDDPWLAFDPTLTGDASAMGTWFLRDESRLPERLERFLAAGEPPMYFGFGSNQVDPQTNRQVIAAAHAGGYRAILYGMRRPMDSGSDIMEIGSVNVAKLFPRTAAIIHAGGLGHTAHVCRSGRPQVVMPRFQDQYYWAVRVQELGVGIACEPLGNLATAIRECLQLAPAAQDLANRVELRGARIAAERLVEQFG